MRPLLTDLTVEVGWIVLFRPFVHHLTQPEFATHLMWGKGDDAHLTNLQTARLHSGPFQTLSFGPDYDHVQSLRERPDQVSLEVSRTPKSMILKDDA